MTDKSASRMTLLSHFLVLAFSAFLFNSGVAAAKNSQSRDSGVSLGGEVLLLSGRGKLGQTHLYALSLAERSLREIADTSSLGGEVLVPFGTPWITEDNIMHVFVVTGANPGLYRVDAISGESRMLLPVGKWLHKGAKDIEIPGTSVGGTPSWYRSPGVQVVFMSWSWSVRSRAEYVMAYFNMSLGPPNWRINLDSLDAPTWVRNVVSTHPRVHETRETWMHIIAVDSTGDVSPISDLGDGSYSMLSVSPDVNLLAYNDASSDISGDPKVKILRASDQTTLTLGIDKDITLRFPAFAPNSNRLAVLGEGEDGVGLYVSRDEEYADFDLVADLDLAGLVMGLSWSPDGDWLLLQVQRLDTQLGILDLIAVQWPTSRIIEIERPYLLDGKPAKDVFISY